MPKPGKTYVWKDPARPALAVTIVMVLNIVVRSASLLTGLIFGDDSLYAADQVDYSTPQLFRLAADLLQLVVYVLCLVIPFWIVRVSRNAHAFTPRLKNSPFGAVAWYIVPFASFYKPYEAMSEIWSASSAPGEADKSRLLNWWWGLFILSGLVGAAAARLNGPGMTPVTLVAHALAITVSVLLILMARRLTRMQRDKHAIWNVFDAPEPQPAGVLESVSG